MPLSSYIWVTTDEMSSAVQPCFFKNILVTYGSTVTDRIPQHISSCDRTARTNSMTSGTQETNAGALAVSFGMFSLSCLDLKIKPEKSPMNIYPAAL